MEFEGHEGGVVSPTENWRAWHNNLEVTRWHPWPMGTWHVDELLCSGPLENRAARFTSLGNLMEHLQLVSVGQAFNLVSLFEEEAWSLGVWWEHTEVYAWVHRQAPSLVEELLRFKRDRVSEYQREMELREVELERLYMDCHEY